MHIENPNLARAQLLMQQRRYQQAEQYIRQALGDLPEDATAHAWLALCLSKRAQHTEATREAQHAVALAPDAAYPHLVLAHIYDDRDMPREALAAVNEAIRLNPEDPDQWALLAHLHSGAKRHDDALKAAEQGLMLDPEHVWCANLRAIALSNLGRKDEAGDSIRAALSREPENAFNHANMGWTLLRQGTPRKAVGHFREALRLEPGNDWARQGLVEAMKARSFVYRIYLAYSLFMSRFNDQDQWVIILGGHFGYLFLLGLLIKLTGSPFISLGLIPLLVLVLGTWLAYPLFNLLLRLNRSGRLALTREQTIAANCLGIAMLIPAVALGVWLLTDAGVAGRIALATVFLIFPVALAGQAREGRPRQIMLVCTALMAVLGALSVSVPSLIGLCLLGAVVATWVSNLADSLPARAKS